MDNFLNSPPQGAHVFSYDDMVSSIQNPLGKKVIINGSDSDTAKKPQKELTEAQVNLRAGIFVVTFLGAIIAAVIFSQTEPVLCIASIGAIFFVIGLINVIQNGVTLESLPSLIFPIAGALMIGIPVIILYHRDHPDSINIDQNGVINIILGAMAVIGLFMLIVPVMSHRSKMRRCTETVTAVCIYRDIHFARSSRPHGRSRHYYLYAPTWQYELGGVIYVTREPIFTDYYVPEIGEPREIRFDPNDPSFIYRPVLRNNAIAMIIGAAFLLAGIATLYLRLK